MIAIKQSNGIYIQFIYRSNNNYEIISRIYTVHIFKLHPY
jgi:hypothetical protein